jgi:hypothetical protein
MTEQEMTAWAAGLSVKAARARSRSRSLQAETAKMAREVSETEEAMAATMDRLASQYPLHAGRLRVMGQAAREHAALERQRLQQYLGARAADDSAG